MTNHYSISVFDSYITKGVHMIPCILEISGATSMFYFYQMFRTCCIRLSFTIIITCIITIIILSLLHNVFVSQRWTFPVMIALYLAPQVHCLTSIYSAIFCFASGYLVCLRRSLFWSSLYGILFSSVLQLCITFSVLVSFPDKVKKAQYIFVCSSQLCISMGKKTR